MLFNLNYYLPSFRDVFPYAGESILGLGIIVLLLHLTAVTTTIKYPLLIEYSSRFALYVLALAQIFNIVLFQELRCLNPMELKLNNDSLITDFEILLLKIIIIFLAMLILTISETFFKETKLGYFEYNILFLCSVLGCLFTLSANDFLSLYISLEIQALAFYIMATIKKSASSSEAGLKYFIIGSFSSALLLFGISLVVLLTGHFVFENVALFLFFQNENLFTVTIGAVLITLALLIKLALAPFHEWVADVYEGVLTPTALFFATIPKISNFFILARLVCGVFRNLFEVIQPLLILVCLLSLILGALNSLKQQNIKRFLAFSSTNHFGFILMGLILGNQIGISASFFYLSFYIILTFAMWTSLILLTYVKTTLNGQTLYQLTRILELGTLTKSNPGVAFSFFLALLSMGAIPPLAGFNSKVSVFYALIATNSASFTYISIALNLVLIVAFFSSLLSVFYYLRIIKILTFVSLVKPVDDVKFAFKRTLSTTVGFFVLATVTVFNLFSFLLFLS